MCRGGLDYPCVLVAVVSVGGGGGASLLFFFVSFCVRGAVVSVAGAVPVVCGPLGGGVAVDVAELLEAIGSFAVVVSFLVVRVSLLRVSVVRGGDARRVAGR
jgi:hypothetical protein